jgi:hypothetical protein
MGRFGTCQEGESRSPQVPWAQPWAPEGRDAMYGPLPEAPTRTRLSSAPSHRPARVAQSSDEGKGEADADRATRSPRFARFAAAMDAAPASQEQLFPRSQRRMRRAHAVDSSVRIRWLRMSIWALMCAALFLSLLLRPDRVSLQLDQIPLRPLVSGARDSMLTTRELLPTHGQEVSSATPATAPNLGATAPDQGTPAGAETDHQ